MSAPRRLTFLVSLWLSLATIFAHALLPSGSPLFRTSGSAFSVSTVDVSIAPKRTGLSATAKKVRRSGADGSTDLLVADASRTAAFLPSLLRPERQAEPAPAPRPLPIESGARSGHAARAPPLDRA